MGVLYAIGGVWALVGLAVLVATVIVVPPRHVREFGLHLQVALGWPWFVGLVVWNLTAALVIKADRS
jgi:hypothetical protein